MNPEGMNEPKRTNNVWCYSSMRDLRVKFIKTAIRLVSREKNGSYCLIDTEFSYGAMKKVMKTDGGDGCTTMWMYLMHWITHFLSSWIGRLLRKIIILSKLTHRFNTVHNKIFVSTFTDIGKIILKFIQKDWESWNNSEKEWNWKRIILPNFKACFIVPAIKTV